MLNFLTKLLISILVLTLIVSVFKNIGYPIIWGDEADTVMYAERILSYGYPKVHDGHNSLNYNMISGNVGVNEKYDAWTVTMWGQYYLASPVVAVAAGFDDIYQKTAVLRSPFAAFGLIGILTVPFIFTPKISKNRKSLFWMCYLLLSILSVSLILHIKEVRSYAFSILLSSLFLNIFVRFYFYKSIKRTGYYFLATIVLFLLINIFPPGYLTISTGVACYVLISKFLDHRKANTGYKAMLGAVIKDILPIIFGGILTLPILVFFKTSGVTSSAYSDMGYSISVYLSYISRVIAFLFRYHFLSILLFLFIFLFFLVKSDKFNSIQAFNNYLKKDKVLTFLLFMYLTYMPVVALTPYMFDRYFLFLQPLTTLLISYLFVIIVDHLAAIDSTQKRQNFNLVFTYALILVFVVNILFISDILKGRVYELTHKYYGPMDAIVDYISVNYKNTRDLVILTNIEQPVLMYYLGSGVICDEMTDCKDKKPDIIIPRAGYLQKEFVRKIEENMKETDYDTVKLPILDYPSNNIPELSLGLRHLYKTPTTDNDEEKVILFVKKR